MSATSSESLVLPRQMLRALRAASGRSKVADSTGVDMTGRQTLMRTLILRRLLRRMLATNEQYVGVLIPPSAGGVLVNAALTLDRRVAVNLNYTASSNTINACIRQCNIRTVLASRKVVERFDLKLDADVLYVEDLRGLVTLWDKFSSALSSLLEPTWLMERRLGLTEIKPDDTLTVIFTSGSTGDPKGVVLSMRNIGSNVEAINQIVHLKASDVLLGILPLFHSLGYTVTLWTVLTLPLKGAYHFSPLEPQQVGKLSRTHGGTILLGTPTFLRSYWKRCSPEDFAKLEVVVAGAEKLPTDLSDAFEQKFGVRPVEGYGCTELSPLVSVNVPASRAFDTQGVIAKEGTVGRPVPGVRARVTDLDTGAELAAEQSGMLWITGPNVMQGYFGQPEKTAEVVRDGWYMTGDVALIDTDGFIRITGRQSRFSKIGGEMVPHLKIEETIEQLLGEGDDTVRIAVTAVPDERKGERIVVLHLQLAISPDEICKQLAAQGLPNLWIPAPDNFVEVAEIPVLGSGKLDLRAVKEAALSRFSQ